MVVSMYYEVAAELAAKLLKDATLAHYQVRSGVQNMYFEVMNQSLQIWAIDNIHFVTDSNIACFVKLSNLSPMDFAIALLLKSLRSPNIHDKYAPKGIFVEGQPQFISHREQSYRSSNETAPFLQLAYEGTSLTNLQATTSPGEQLTRHT